MSLHLIWLGSEPSAEKLSAVSRWQNKFGDNVKLWTEKDLPNLPDGPWRNPAFHPAQRADLLRVSLLSWFGGWYADIDCQPGTTQLPQPNHVLLAREDTRQFINCLFYAPKEAQFLKYWVEELELSLQENHRTSIAEATGPGALTRALHAYALDFGAQHLQTEIKYLAWKDFRHWPQSVTGPSNADRLPSARFASHIAEASWISDSENKAESSRLALWVWKMRHGRFADVSEFVRIALKNPDLAQASIQSKALRKALYHSSLDSINKGLIEAIEPIEVESVSDLKAIARRDSVAVIQTESSEVSKKLHLAGWEKLSSAPQLWFRPRPTSLMNEYNSMTNDSEG